jgi:hypothetical protein
VLWWRLREGVDWECGVGGRVGGELGGEEGDCDCACE